MSAAATSTIATATATAVIQYVTVTATPAPVLVTYYSTWVSCITTLSAFTTVLGFLVMGLVGFSLFVLVAIMSSLGATLAYGVIFIQWYRPALASMVSNIAISAFTDTCWWIEVASLSFYSFLIVRKILRGQKRVLYLTVFWALQFGIFACRVGILAFRIIGFKNSEKGAGANQDEIIIDLHVAYFVLIASCESWNAYFLLRKFYKANQNRVNVLKSISSSLATNDTLHSTASKKRRRFGIQNGFYSYFLMSSEIRLASLASIGILRALMWGTHQHGVGQQLDAFACTMEVLFPMLYLVDILAAKLAFQDHVGIQSGRGGAGASHSASYSYPQAAPHHSIADQEGFHDEEKSLQKESKLVSVNSIPAPRDFPE